MKKNWLNEFFEAENSITTINFLGIFDVPRQSNFSICKGYFKTLYMPTYCTDSSIATIRTFL